MFRMAPWREIDPVLSLPDYRETSQTGLCQTTDTHLRSDISDPPLSRHPTTQTHTLTHTTAKNTARPIDRHTGIQSDKQTDKTEVTRETLVLGYRQEQRG